MSAATWQMIAIVGFTLSGVALVITVFIFLRLNIPAIIGDLTGKTVAREIKAMREANFASGNKLHRSSSVNINRGKLTEKVNGYSIDDSARAAAHMSKRLDTGSSEGLTHLRREKKERRTDMLPKGRITETFSANVGEVNMEEIGATAILSQNRATEVLVEVEEASAQSECPQTEVFSQTETPSQTRRTEILSQNRSVQECLTDDAEEPPVRAGTSVLDAEPDLMQRAVNPVAFRVTRSVVVTHTDETIKNNENEERKQ